MNSDSPVCKLHVDLSGVADADVRDELWSSLKAIVLEGYFGRGKTTLSMPKTGYWDVLSDGPKPSRGRYMVVADWDRCLEHFEELGPHRWSAGIRKLHPSILAFRRGGKRRRDMKSIDAIFHASDGRLFICDFKAGDRSLQERTLARALAAMDPDSLVEVRSTGEQLWLEFGDGLRQELDWHRIPLPAGCKLQHETARVSDDLSALEVLDAEGHVVDIDGAALRSLVDPRAAESIRSLRKAGASSLGERLRSKRSAAGITQEELEARTGLDQPAISRLEAGVHQPRFDTLAKYAKGLGLTVSQLLQ